MPGGMVARWTQAGNPKKDRKRLAQSVKNQDFIMRDVAQDG